MTESAADLQVSRWALVLASVALILLSAGGALLGLTGIGYAWSRLQHWTIGHAILLGIVCVGTAIGLGLLLTGHGKAVRPWVSWVFAFGTFVYLTGIVWDALSVARSVPWFAALADAFINAGAAVVSLGLWRATVWHRTVVGDG